MNKFRIAFSSSRVTGEALDARSASVGVHKSLFSNLQQIGYPGSAAALGAWALIKAVRPKMSEHHASLRSLEELAPSVVKELRDVAVKTSRAEKTSSSPARSELIGDIIAMLDGLLSQTSPPSPDSGARPARAGGLAAVEALADQMSARRAARCAELLRAGKSDAETLAQVEAEGL